MTWQRIQRFYNCYVAVITAPCYIADHTWEGGGVGGEGVGVRGTEIQKQIENDKETNMQMHTQKDSLKDKNRHPDRQGQIDTGKIVSCSLNRN